MKKLKVIVVGGGFWGKNQLRVLSEMKKVKLVGICDIEESKAKMLGEKYNIPWFTDLDEALNKLDFDAATICTPTITHAEIAKKILANGKHVLIEKPMTSTIEEGKELITLAEKNKVFLTVGFIERFNPAIKQLKKIIKAGKLGRIILILARRVTRWPERIGDVGVTKDSAIHDIDVMRFLLEKEVSSVYAKIGSLKHRFEDYSEIMMSFEENTVGFIDANWLTPRKIRTLIVTGSEATATVNYLTQELTIENSKLTIKPKINWEEPLYIELKNFVESILKGVQPEPTGLDGLKALEVCEAILKSGKLNQVVKLL
ncbi:MAG: Gfo/Idh/MocA family oxidoreductase [Candidatus Bathyarchaeia archaeon]|nr:Gfo/Idh/MocA family oxidoreductase [Candidatus Bathyarchaeota archaeon]